MGSVARNTPSSLSSLTKNRALIIDHNTPVASCPTAEATPLSALSLTPPPPPAIPPPPEPQHGKNPSETTIFSIYSMYGDDRSSRLSFSAAGSVEKALPSGNTTTLVNPRVVSLQQKQNGQTRCGGLDEDLVSSSLSEKRKSGSGVPPPGSYRLNGNGNGHSPTPSPRHSSAGCSTHHRPHSSSLGSMMKPSVSASSTTATDATTATTAVTDFGPDMTMGGSPRPVSIATSYTSARSTMLLDPSSSSPLVLPHSTRSQTPSITVSSEPPQESPVNLVAGTSQFPFLVPSTPDVKGEHTRTSTISDDPLLDSPASKISVVPSEGEENDSFHVRRTYAVLDVCGVKGDGYEEGVERTRARIGNSRQSQLNAREALGDEAEKTRDLSPEEMRLLGSLDRYGFYTLPSHDRLILLPSAPLLKRLSPVKAGPPNAPSQATSLSSLPPAQPLLHESRRIGKWTRMLVPISRDQGGNIQEWSIKPSKEGKLRERTYKGIPDRWRSAAWDLFIARYGEKDGGSGSRVEGPRLAREYGEALERPSTYDVQIDLDVPRTISGHVMFRTRYGAGQRSLFHVLHSFSQRCESCGYVQGMGPIAATLLCYLSPDRVYTALTRLHTAYSLHSIFNPGFPGLLEAIYIQERITATMMPDVFDAFKRHVISTTSYATKWYITMFANSVPFQMQLRMWDAFLLDGPDVFVGVAVGVVWVYRDHITSSSANFETVLSLLSSFFVPEDENVFMAWVEKTLGDRKLRRSIERWRVEWRQLVKEGKDAQALL